MRPVLLGCVLLGIAIAFMALRRESPSGPSSTALQSRAAATGNPSGVSTKGTVHDPRPPRDQIDLPAKLSRLMAAGDDVGLQKAASNWFEADPAAVREWLDAQPSFARLQPVLVQLAKDIAASGQPAEALKWAELLEDGPDRDRTLFEIYAMGRRYGSLSDEEIRAAPFTPRQIGDLLSGAADD